MSVDPRLQLKNILLGIATTIDDGVTAAQILIQYMGGPETLRWHFEVTAMDVVIEIERHTERESGIRRRIQDVPLRYNAEIPVHIIAINKTGVTATKLLNKIRLQMQTVIEAAAQQATYTIILLNDRPNNMRIGGYDPLWRDDYIVTHRPMES